MRGIEVRERGEEGMLVELGGEFDRHDLKDLRETLDDVLSLRLPVALNLSGVNFLDVEATRELTIYSYLYSHHLTLRNPSWQVRASVAACGLGPWLDFRHEADDATYPRASQPPAFSSQRSAKAPKAKSAPCRVSLRRLADSPSVLGICYRRVVRCREHREVQAYG